MATGAFNIQVSGHAPARRDVTLEIISETTGEKRTVTPFLDGSAMVRGLPTGAYQVRVLHPNVVGELVDMRRVRLFEGLPTRITLPLPEDLFRDTPVRRTPDTDLTPVRDAAVSARDLVGPAGGKKPGDPIRSEDWNAVVGALGDLAGAVAELTRLVAPQGHDHHELEEKIDEVNGNVRRFTDQFGAQLARIQRTLQTLAIERQVNDTFAAAGTVPDAVRAAVAESVGTLKSYSDSDTLIWGARKKTAYATILRAMGDLRDAQPDPTPLEDNELFKSTLVVATEEASVAAPRTVGGEIDQYGKVNAKTSGALLYRAFGA
ncbi:hypothetical protein [Frankia sp. QA3]|uniref:hypothetical protein n=1 Tax=Frankia sp. QA3 TaxID=710111 RepID=UPI000269BEFB|nr:hypothetical protein [Frankia sp. QA3]EIV92711.1 hypothetical protein FraQA3DRAFT_2321 [Frankia sp. QA3]